MARPLFPSLAAALGCLVLVPALSACGSSKKPCSSSTCQGCCDTAGQCQAGNTPQACGTLGAFCSVCPPTQTCQFSLCTPLTGAGGGGSSSNGGGGGGGFGGGAGGGFGGGAGGGFGGGAGGGFGGGGGGVGGGAGGGVPPGCGPRTCNGCCQGQNCVTSPSASACGSGGLACQACFSMQECIEGSCYDFTCNGCRTASACEPGDTAQACGFSGRVCRQCAPGASCTDGSCFNPTCNGCQDELGRCFPGNSNEACGSGGTRCYSCGAMQACQQNFCQYVLPDGGACKGPEQECSSSAECCSGGCDSIGFYCTVP